MSVPLLTRISHDRQASEGKKRCQRKRETYHQTSTGGTEVKKRSRLGEQSRWKSSKESQDALKREGSCQVSPEKRNTGEKEAGEKRENSQEDRCLVFNGGKIGDLSIQKGSLRRGAGGMVG